MILETIKLYAYKLPLYKKLQLGKKNIAEREGFVIEIKTETDVTAYSEIAPLPSFSMESMSDVIKEVVSFKEKFAGKPVPSDILQQLTVYTPSVRFGIESAFLQITAQSKKLTLVDLLNPTAKQIVSVNALLIGSQSEVVERVRSLYDDGYRAFKMKIGRGNLDDEISTIHKVRQIVGDDSLIRLDANCAFDYETAISFYEQIKNLNIDYIEEPFETFELTKKQLLEHGDSMPIALDESLAEIQPEMLNEMYALKAIVLKPTLLGYTNTMMFAKKAFALGIQPVISSSFETSLGTYLLASMGAIIDSKIPIGLDTLSWFADDIVENRLIITNGKIDLSNYVALPTQIDFSKLSEVTLDNV